LTRLFQLMPVNTHLRTKMGKSFRLKENNARPSNQFLK
jgi:hypothetical protein